MALISLFTTTRAKLDQMELDCSISETHTARATVSKSEIEDGENISDNVNLENIQLTLEATISRTPLGVSGLIGSAATTAAGALAAKASSAVNLAAKVGAASVAGLVSGLVNGPGGEFTDDDGNVRKVTRKPGDVYAYLLELRDRAYPFTVVTALKKYDDMIITSISVPRSVDTVGELRFTVELEQVQIVSSETATLTLVSALGQGAGAKQSLGKQSGSAVTTKAVEPMSNLFGFANGLPVSGIPGGN